MRLRNTIFREIHVRPIRVGLYSVCETDWYIKLVHCGLISYTRFYFRIRTRLGSRDLAPNLMAKATIPTRNLCSSAQSAPELKKKNNFKQNALSIGAQITSQTKFNIFDTNTHRELYLPQIIINQLESHSAFFHWSK